jgi:uncharacterized protein (DUF934 family)
MSNQLILNKKIVNNDWVFLLPVIEQKEVKKQAGKVVMFKVTGENFPEDDDLNKIKLPDVSKILLPLKLYLLRKDEIEKKYSEVGLWVYSHEDFQWLLNLNLDLNKFSVIGIYIEKFADGRIYSLGNLIRRKLKFKNDLRALGDILKDQLFFLDRSGFSSFLIKEGRSAEEAIKGLSDFSHSYQATLDEIPSWRKNLNG